MGSLFWRTPCVQLTRSVLWSVVFWLRHSANKRNCRRLRSRDQSILTEIICSVARYVQLFFNQTLQRRSKFSSYFCFVFPVWKLMGEIFLFWTFSNWWKIQWNHAMFEQLIQASQRVKINLFIVIRSWKKSSTAVDCNIFGP